MKPAIVILTCMLITGGALPAAAEGTWVLWVKHVPHGSRGYWDLWGTYSSKTQCEGARSRLIYDGLLRDTLKAEVHKTDEQLQEEARRILASDTRHRCLPDTEDPRETD